MTGLLRVAAVLALALTLAGCPASTPVRSCADADGPITREDVGWNPQLDRDGDGVACE